MTVRSVSWRNIVQGRDRKSGQTVRGQSGRLCNYFSTEHIEHGTSNMEHRTYLEHRPQITDYRIQNVKNIYTSVISYSLGLYSVYKTAAVFPL